MDNSIKIFGELLKFPFEKVVTSEDTNRDYNAYILNVGGVTIQYRDSRITAKKVGQFVAFWKRDSAGQSTPYDTRDNFDYLVIYYKTADYDGWFIFDKNTLIDKKYISNEQFEGKRGFRVYAPATDVVAKQALVTKEWQSKHFYDRKQLALLELF